MPAMASLPPTQLPVPASSLAPPHKSRIAPGHYTRGRRPAQGMACSNWLAIRNKPSSPPSRAVNIIPTGKPLSLMPSGRDIAGCPLTLAHNSTRGH